MKMFVAALAILLFAAAQAATVTYRLGNCIRLDVDANLTITVVDQNGTTAASGLFVLSDLTPTIVGNCSDDNATSSTMTVNFPGGVSWDVFFNVNDAGVVSLDQLVKFTPSLLFNNTDFSADPQGLSDVGSNPLSPSNASWRCISRESISFNSNSEANYTYSLAQSVQDMQVQAFNLQNDTFSDAVSCAADATTTVAPVEPTTAPAPTEPTPPTAGPVAAQSFVLRGADGVPCFRMEAGLQVAVEYLTVNNTMAFSQLLTMPGTSVVNGTCGNSTTTPAVLTLTSADLMLEVTETSTAAGVASTLRLVATLDAANFPFASDVNGSLEFSSAPTFQQSSADTFYVCSNEQALTFANSSTTLYANSVKLQAFALNNGSFTGNGEECSLDPTPSPAPTPAPTPGENTYVVNGTNVTCIVLKGDITFANIMYTKTTGDNVTASPINIPAMNATSGNVQYSGTCGNTTQTLVVTFNSNWTLTMTFQRGQTSSMLGATSQDEYSVTDIQLVYFLAPEFFPDAADARSRQEASQMNITSDLWKGSIDGGSYRCDADVTQTLSGGVEMQTKNLQYKAFNNDETTGFGSNVSECSGDSDSNSIVPIAVGAALAGLVVIVLIAYLIGRRRSRRQGYESV